MNVREVQLPELDTIAKQTEFYRQGDRQMQDDPQQCLPARCEVVYCKLRRIPRRGFHAVEDQTSVVDTFR